MTSHTFTGQSYALQKGSSTPECCVWRAKELCNHSHSPHDGEQQKACEEIPEARWVRRMMGMQIDLNGVVEYEDIEEEERAGEPREIGLEERHRLRETLRRKPMVFVWQINELWRQNGNHLWYRKSNHRDNDAHNDHNSEERLPGLPAIRNATSK